MVFIGKSKDKNKDTFCLYDNYVQSNVECTVKPVNKGHSGEPENVPCMSNRGLIQSAKW